MEASPSKAKELQSELQKLQVACQATARHLPLPQQHYVRRLLTACALTDTGGGEDNGPC